jgi:hypothetical protein
MRITKIANGAYTLEAATKEIALLTKIEKRFAPATASELLSQVVNAWIIGHDERFKQEMLALYDTLSLADQEKVRALLEGLLQ